MGRDKIQVARNIRIPKTWLQKMKPRVTETKESCYKSTVVIECLFTQTQPGKVLERGRRKFSDGRFMSGGPCVLSGKLIYCIGGWCSYRTSIKKPERQHRRL